MFAGPMILWIMRFVFAMCDKDFSVSTKYGIAYLPLKIVRQRMMIM